MKKILFVTSEARPFAASGGLGDVAGSLPVSLKEAGGEEVDVRVVMPLYASVSQEFRDQMVDVCEFIVPLAWRKQYCGILSLLKNGETYETAPFPPFIQSIITAGGLVAAINDGTVK